MRIITLIIILLLLGIHPMMAQFFDNNFTKIIKNNKKLAKCILLSRECNTIDEKIYFWQHSQELDYLPVSSFIISEKAISYDSTKSIIDFIVFNKKNPLQEFYTFKNGSYEGVKSLFNDVYFNGKGFSSGYDTSKVFLHQHYNTSMYNMLQELKKYNFDFLFAVKYFRNTIWFVENKKIYLIDDKDLKIYNPDDYIRQKCSVQQIRNMAAGKNIKFCDF